jgi:DNA-binding IclR family transcriptional regulator
VLLASQPEEYVKQVLDLGLKAFTPKTIVRNEELLETLAEVAQRDYATDDEESETGLRAVASPVRNHNGVVIAAVGLAAPVQRMSKKVMQTCVPSVIAAANAVSARLGYVP